MTYIARREAGDYEKAAEWICIKALGDIKVSKEAVKILAEAMADVYNRAYDDAVIGMSSMKRRQKP